MSGFTPTFSALNPLSLETDTMQAIDKKDQYVVFNGFSNVDIESWPTKGAAMRACHVLNTHEKSNGREQVYRVLDKSNGGIFFQEGI